MEKLNTTNAVEVAARIELAAQFAEAEEKTLKNRWSVLSWNRIRDQFGLGLVAMDTLVSAIDIISGKIDATAIVMETKPVTTTTTKAPRVKVLGHAPTAILRWMGSKGWSAEKAAKAIFELGAEDIADGTIRIQLARGKKGVGGEIATLTPYQIRKVTAAAK